MICCKLQKNDYPEIKLLFGEQYICNYRSDVYNLYEFEQVDSVSFSLDFYKQFLQEETEEDAKEWCLKIIEKDIFEHLYEILEADTEDETNPPKKLADFFSMIISDATGTEIKTEINKSGRMAVRPLSDEFP